MASEEMLFENVDDDGWTADAWLYYRLTYEPPDKGAKMHKRNHIILSSALSQGFKSG